MRMLLVGALLSSAIAASAAGCGGSSSNPAEPPVAVPVEAGAEDAPAVDSAPPVDNGAPSTNYPAPHPPLPELVNMAKGKVLATPKVYMIYYPGYAFHEASAFDYKKRFRGAEWFDWRGSWWPLDPPAPCP